ncbi:cupredoxin domain-containing protein [Blastococcus atacamensis]|uniref:cupredoxin domain-containing protein n=1 Tax=Blastococcus atacamensis TaxID=2070508 RepID=UPI001E3D024E|nr:cupredoxin domain-containing protein [Blastococcus atacamensis]
MEGSRPPHPPHAQGGTRYGATAGRCRKAAVAAALLVLSGCGGSGEKPPAPTPEGLGEVTIGADGVQEVTLQTQDDYLFTPDTFTVAPGPVRLTLVNVADQMTHNLEFTDEELPAPIGAGISVLAPGQEMTIDFEVTTPGDYPFSCTFHIQLGQVGTMTVSE